MKVATCIGCGCDDLHACDLGCSWLRVDRKANLGVCSTCQRDVARWDAGDRKTGHFVLFFRTHRQPVWFCDSTATLKQPNTTNEQVYARRFMTRGAAQAIATKLGIRCGKKFSVVDLAR